MRPKTRKAHLWVLLPSVIGVHGVAGRTDGDNADRAATGILT
jgi:hypothetical protein